MNTPDPHFDPLDHSHDLCAQDAQAMEALVEAGFDCDRVSPDLRDRARKCAVVLGLLEFDITPVSDQSLVDATLVRVAWARRNEEISDLAPRDEDALEALIAAGFDPARCPSSVRSRATRHADMLARLDMPVSGAERETLIERTLVGVQASIDAGEKRLAVSPAPERARFSFRWGDLVSVAALLLIASAVIAPMVGAVRGMYQQTGCQAGLASAFKGFSSYANDFKESLPLASDSRAGSRWWNIGNVNQSNSANLFTLQRVKSEREAAAYARPDDLACPGNTSASRSVPAPDAVDWTSSDAISYSYRNMFTNERVSMASAVEPFVVLADRSPVITRAMRGEWVNPHANSDNHMGRGQNVMFSNGVVRWMSSPVLKDGDNLWLPKTLEDIVATLQNPNCAAPLKGNETPAGKTDVFLSP